MSAIITEKFRQHNAEQFLESFSETSSNNYYLFIGKSSAYSTSTTGGDDNTPPAPNDDIVNEFRAWDAMLAAKLISSTDVGYVVARKTWANNTTYDMYQHDISSTNAATSGEVSLWESDFYFMTSENKVYKVLDNAGGTVPYSGAEPTSTQTTPFFLGGYYIKYMYTLSSSATSKFLTNDFIPVESDTTVVNTAIDGAVEVVKVVAGSGYTDGTYYSPIDGDGSNGIVKIVISGGAIQRFGSTGFTEVFNKGTGYTFGNVDLTDVYSDTGLTSASTVGSGVGGSVIPIISPKGGHGSNPAYELGAHYVMMNAKLLQAEGDDFTVANDFREVGIVVDPYLYGTTNVSSLSTARQSFAVKLAAAPVTDFTIDEKITQSTTGAVGKIVEWDATNNIIYFVQEHYVDHGLKSDGTYVAFSGQNLITGANSGATGVPSSTASETVTLTNGNTVTFTSGYANPELEPYSGKIIYNEKRRPISRAADQSEDIKIIVEF